MTETPSIDVGTLILGGGIAGLWILDELRRAGVDAVLFESNALGAAQTGWSQGIIHGGLKYTLSGLFSDSAKAIREMPLTWRECLAGAREPDLSHVHVRSQHCYLWQTDSLRSKAGMIGARAGLRVAPVVLAPSDRPPILHDCPGTVARLDEQVVDSFSLVRAFAERNAGRVLEGVATSITRDDAASDHRVLVAISSKDGTRCANIRTGCLVLAAGIGNGPLRRLAGLDADAMQTRPLHMSMVRGDLPELHGHCVDGARTRVTITSADLPDGKRVWQIGGQLAEDGVTLESRALIKKARAELHAAIPGFDAEGTHCEWATYRADRAEAATGAGARPDDVAILTDGLILTAWPTKLALAPRLAERVREMVPPSHAERADGSPLPEWPRAVVGEPAWSTAGWLPDESVG